MSKSHGEGLGIEGYGFAINGGGSGCITARDVSPISLISNGGGSSCIQGEGMGVSADGISKFKDLNPVSL